MSSVTAPADTPRPLPRRALVVVALLVGVGLAVLLGYSLDRTAWAFTIYETGQENADQLGWNAALVLEIAAVALIIGMSAVGVLPEPYSSHVRRWAGPCLAAILAVQISANMTAGFLRGSLPMYRELAATGMVAGPALWAAYVVQAALWFSINGIIPLLIFGLSKIEAQLVAALLAAPEAAPAGSNQVKKDRVRRRWPSWGQYSPNGVSAGSYQLEGDSALVAPATPPNGVSAGRYQLEKDRGGDVSAPTAATGATTALTAAPVNGVSAGSYQLEGDSAPGAHPTTLNRVSAGRYQLEKDRGGDVSAPTAATDAATAWQVAPTAPPTAATAPTATPPNGVSAGSYQLEGDSAPVVPPAPANRVSAGRYQLEKDRTPTTAAPVAATEAPVAATGATTALAAAPVNGVSAGRYQLEKDRAQAEPATVPTAAPADRVSAGSYQLEGDSDLGASPAAPNGVSAGRYQLEKDRAPTTAATDAAVDDRSGPQRPAADAVQVFARSGVTAFVTAGDDPALPPQPIYPPPVAVNSTAIYPCPHGCGAMLTFSEKGAAKRHQHCKHCPPADATT